MPYQSDYAAPISQPETYPGTLRGYRNFGYPDNGSFKFKLHPVTAAKDYPLNAREEWWTSVCTHRDPDSPYAGIKSFTPRGPHEIPSRDCKCGYYVNYYEHQSFYASWMKYPRGVVECSGKIIFAEKGFRAQKMKLIAITTEDPDLISELDEFLPHVRIFSDVNEMYTAFPQDDLTNLIGQDLVKKNKEDQGQDMCVNWKHVYSVLGPPQDLVSKLNASLQAEFTKSGYDVAKAYIEYGYSQTAKDYCKWDVDNTLTDWIKRYTR